MLDFFRNLLSRPNNNLEAPALLKLEKNININGTNKTLDDLYNPDQKLAAMLASIDPNLSAHNQQELKFAFKQLNLSLYYIIILSCNDIIKAKLFLQKTLAPEYSHQEYQLLFIQPMQRLMQEDPGCNTQIEKQNLQTLIDCLSLISVYARLAQRALKYQYEIRFSDTTTDLALKNLATITKEQIKLVKHEIEACATSW